MNSENSITSHSRKLFINLTDQTDLRSSKKNVALLKLSIYIHGKI